MKLLIAGDLSLQNRACNKWTCAEIQQALVDVKMISNRCDYAVVNLESPVTTCLTPIVKDGPTLKNTPTVFDIIKYCGFNVVTLANNHLKDYGSQGVIDTLQNCKAHGILTVGAGKDICSARTPLVLKDNHHGVEVGVINVCEHESSIALTYDAGTAPLDYPNLYEDIYDLKKHVDVVMVIIHGGRELYHLPTPRMKREYRMIADFGADIIVNHHQHCYSGYEIYKGKPIFYGLGNFFFDDPSEKGSVWNYGLLLQITIEKGNIDFSFTPYEQCNKETIFKIYPNDNSIFDNIEELNQVIQDNKELEDSFIQMVNSTKPLYPFLPFGNKIFRFFYFKKMIPTLISKKNKARILNAISCETHREVLMRYLSNSL